MAKILVPKEVFPGFKIIKDLTDSQLDNLIDYLNKVEVGRFFGDIASDLSDILKADGDALFRTLLSFTELFSAENEDVSILSKDLAESYKELSSININSKETDRLKANLLTILSNFEKIRLTDKAREYRIENSNNFRDFKILTDIRFMESEGSNEKYGIILHKLFIEYQNANPINELHLHIGLPDLIELKTAIEKAIERDKNLRESSLADFKLI
nr:hypothetical protein [uncultured Fluviicola sp.]